MAALATGVKQLGLRMHILRDIRLTHPNTAASCGRQNPNNMVYALGYGCDSAFLTITSSISDAECADDKIWILRWD